MIPAAFGQIDQSALAEYEQIARSSSRLVDFAAVNPMAGYGHAGLGSGKRLSFTNPRCHLKAVLLVVLSYGVPAIAGGNLAHRNYQDVTETEILSYVGLMTENYGLSKEKISDDRFSRYACSVGGPQEKTWKSADGGDVSWCEDLWATMLLWRCASIKAFNDHLSHCGKALKRDMESLESIYCLVTLTTLELYWKVFMEAFEFGGCHRWARLSTADFQKWCYDPTPDDHPHFFAIGRYFVDHYHLKAAPNTTYVCNMYSENRFDLEREHPQIYNSILLMKTAASLQGRFRYGSRLPKVSEMCWEPTLQGPNELYLKPGRWNVSMECVTLLQTLAAKMFRNMTRRYNAYFHHSDESLSKSLDYITSLYAVDSRFRKWFPALFRYRDEVRTVVYDAEDPINQLQVYPIFRRFEDTVRRRQTAATGDMTSSSSADMTSSSSAAVVSCDGLQGTREDVVATVIQLLRLVIVNDLHVLPYWRIALEHIIPFNHFLPCLVEEAI